MLCFFGVVNPQTILRFDLPQNSGFNTRQLLVLTHSLFVLSEKVQNQSAYGAKQKLFVKFLYTKVCGFPKGKALGVHRSVRKLVQKRKPPRLNSRYFA